MCVGVRLTTTYAVDGTCAATKTHKTLKNTHLSGCGWPFEEVKLVQLKQTLHQWIRLVISFLVMWPLDGSKCLPAKLLTVEI